MATNIIPTKGNLISLKRSLARAKLGFELLDRKRNVLMREMMKLIDEYAEALEDYASWSEQGHPDRDLVAAIRKHLGEA